MKYQYNPHQTRSAYENIARLFPMVTSKELKGLEALFKMLEQMDLEAARQWGRTLGLRELDMLCRHFARTNRSRVILAIAILLASRGDRRCTQVLHYFYLLDPSEGDWQLLLPYWSQLKIETLTAGHLPWLGRFLEKNPMMSALDFVKEELAAEKLTPEILLGHHAPEITLFQALIDWLFTDGVKWLHTLPANMASEFASTYLYSGCDDKVQAYLQHYPSEDWTEDLLDGLYHQRGAPDPVKNTFYRNLDPGIRWSIRTRLFSHHLEGMHARRRALWERWIHRCSDWKNIQTIPHITIHPFKIVEELDRTLVFLLENPLKAVEIIEDGPNWEKELETVLSEYLQWGSG